MERLAPNETNQKFVASLQALRFLAASMVLISHLLIETRAHPLRGMIAVYDPTKIKWATGVDIFFIISGFIIYYLTKDKFGVPGFAKSFIKNRFVRVVPLYWVYLTLFIIVALVSKSSINGTDISLMRVVSSYLFLPWPRSDGTFYPVFEIGWTLNFEIMFYFVFSAALLFSKKAGLTLLSAAFIMLAMFGLLTRTSISFLMFYTRPIIIEFLFGILIAHFYVKGIRLPALVRITMVAAGFIALTWAVAHSIQSDIHLRPFWGGIPAALIVSGVVLGPDIRGDAWYTNLIVIGGNVSYSLYLTHMFSLRLLSIIWEKLALPGGLLYFGVSFTVAMFGAYVAYRIVEQPLLALMRRGVRRKSATAAVTV
jgi:peptidoglycan/LPS O-acetylase OafA/YrhL